MARYVDIDKARIYVSDFVCEQLKKIPTADVVEVVFCGKCKHCDHCYPAKAKDEEALEGWYCNTFRQWRKPTDFCSYGVKGEKL